MKLHYCFLKKFNNYFNRKIIKYNDLQDYIDHSADSFIPVNSDGSMTQFDFNPNDNVITEIIANDLTFEPDYFLLIDDESNIVSRWFVLEQKRNRNKQWLYHLRRDVIADNFNELLNAPIFVEKGMLREDDPFIVNDEGMSLNQIKRAEIKLLDKSRTAWIVGYLSKKSNISVTVGSQSIDVDYNTLSDIASDMGISESTLLDRINFGSDTTKRTIFSTGDVQMMMYLQQDTTGPIDNYYYFKFVFNNDFSQLKSSFRDTFDIAYHPYLFKKYGGITSQQVDNLKAYFSNAVLSNRSNWLSGIAGLLGRGHYFTESQMIALNRYNGALVKYNNTYYRLNVLGTGTSTTTKTNIAYDGVNIALKSTVETTIANASSDYELHCEPSYELRELSVNNQEYIISMQEASVEDEVPQITATVSSGRKPTEDQAYDIFAIPLNITINDGTEFNTSEVFSRIVASDIATQGDSIIYDLQLLPYCPIPDMVSNYNYIDITGLTENADFDYIKYNDNGNDIKCGIIFYISQSTFKTTITDININNSKSKKVVSNCYMWRLCSPNYQGTFDFNIAKNGGNVPSFNVFCTYKPYTPIIKVAPAFDWLYGMEYQDNRGLICGGDFSLPRVSDAWVSYQLNNKNYQNIFNREIQHLDFVQGIEMRNQIISGAVGILGDSAKGAGAGAMAGGPWGAVAGAVIGTATSAVGFGVDVDTMARTHRENRQLAIDKFNYQLGNIKALPYTLTKVGSFDVISKIFPFIEEYSCSDKELEAFENKIRYESMTVMRIGTMKEFANFNSSLNYFKGSLIRCDDIADDTHILNAIYEEFLRGVYI